MSPPEPKAPGLGEAGFITRDIASAVTARALRLIRHQLHSRVQDGVQDVRLAVSHPGHGGDPARAIDVDLHEHVAEWLRAEVAKRLPSLRLVVDSEEEYRSYIREPRTLIAIVDPIDGTSVLLRTGDGYGVAIQFLLIEEGGPVALGGAIASSVGFVVSWTCQVPADVAVETVLVDEDREATTSGLRWARPSGTEDGELFTIASVAAAPTRRRLLREQTMLIEDERITLDLRAGNPALVACAWLGVGGIYEVKSARVRDVLFLLPLQMLGWLIEDHTGNRLDPQELIERLAGVNGAFPAYIAASTQAGIDLLRSLMRPE